MAIVLDGTNGITGPATKAIVGTTTNDSAAAGYVGEYISSTVSSQTVTGSATNMTSISLTAGDWDITAQAGSAGVGAGVTTMRLCISSVSASFTSVGGFFGVGDITAFPDTVNGLVGVTIPPIRVSIASTTTYYLVTYKLGGSNFSANGLIAARRVR